MNREYRDLIDLGAVTLETKGGPIGRPDVDGTFNPVLGLSDE